MKEPDYYGEPCWTGVPSTNTNLPATSSLTINDNAHANDVDCQETGTYYIVWVDLNSTSTQYYVPYEYDTSLRTVTFVTDHILDSDIPFSGATIFDTKFLTLTASLSATSTVELTTTYYIDPEEVDRSNTTRNPTMVRYGLNLQPSTDITTYSEHIGTSTGNGTSTHSRSVVDGTYEALVNFGNAGTPLTGIVPFQQTYIYLTFTVSASGTVLQVQEPEIYTNETEATNAFNEPCDFNHIGGCIVNAIGKLLVPSEGKINGLYASVVSSDASFIQEAVNTYSLLRTTVDDGSPAVASSALSINLDFEDEAGFTVTIFSINYLTQLMGDSKPIFRGLAEIALYIGFLTMLVSSVNNILTLNSDPKEKAL